MNRNVMPAAPLVRVLDQLAVEPYVIADRLVAGGQWSSREAAARAVIRARAQDHVEVKTADKMLTALDLTDLWYTDDDLAAVYA